MSTCNGKMWIDSNNPTPFGGAADILQYVENAESNVKRPTVVTIECAAGEIGIGVGLVSYGLVTYTPSPPDAPYWISSGDKSDTGIVAYDFDQGHYTEFDAASLVPLGLCKRAVLELVVTAKLPSYVDWIEI